MVGVLGCKFLCMAYGKPRNQKDLWVELDWAWGLCAVFPGDMGKV